VRVLITRRPTEENIDGVPLGYLEVGRVYGVPTEIATLLIVEGWAEPVIEDVEPTLPSISFNVMRPCERRRSRFMSGEWLRRELGIAADRRRPE
jgi:hypothetical protein